MTAGSIPLQSGADPNDPRSFAAFAFVALPMGATPGNAPLITHPDVYGDWSKRLWELGFRHHRELQTHRLVEPVGGYRPYGPPLTLLPLDKAAAADERAAAVVAEAQRSVREQAAALMPDLVARIEGMTETEKAAARKQTKAELKRQMTVIAEMLKQVDESGGKS